jgi:NADH-ubiquinone oxidoreductase chain 5
MNENIITIIGICILIGAMAKSSQLGLHVWLPFAMEGPTPVSALIHAATMVTAGVYLLMRTSPLIEYSSTVLILCL